ncbi:hypothetical protein Hdeb2414_s0077g00777091 [Helianthus debilis subsp. tardiflorus]
MLKLSKMPAMVNPREIMTVLNMTVVQTKTFQLQLKMSQLQVQVQARMDLNVNHQGRLLILMQIGQHLRVIPVRFLACADAKGEENMFDDKLRMKTRREGTQKIKMIELPLTIINTTRI